MLQRSPVLYLGWVMLVGIISPSCVENNSHVMPTVSRGIRQAHMARPAIPENSYQADRLKEAVNDHDHQNKKGKVLATVNGHAIMRHRVVELLLRAYGPDLLEQLIVLDRAQRDCAQQGLIVVQQDIDEEYERMLRQIADPLVGMSKATIPRQQAEQMLSVVLQQRNLSREEFMIGVRRNAYLRKLVGLKNQYTQAQMQAEYDRVYGQRFVVRHIQLASPAEASRASDQLSSGVDFPTVANRYSANRISADQGGRLDPFSAEDDMVPQAMRDVVKRLSVGQVSEPIRIGRWYHIVRLESVIAADAVVFDDVRDKIVQHLHERASPEAMRQLYQSLLAGAQVNIVDDTLRTAWQRKLDMANP